MIIIYKNIIPTIVKYFLTWLLFYFKYLKLELSAINRGVIFYKH